MTSTSWRAYGSMLIRLLILRLLPCSCGLITRSIGTAGNSAASRFTTRAAPDRPDRVRRTRSEIPDSPAGRTSAGARRVRVRRRTSGLSIVTGGSERAPGGRPAGSPDEHGHDASERRSLRPDSSSAIADDAHETRERTASMRAFGSQASCARRKRKNSTPSRRRRFIMSQLVSISLTISQILPGRK